MANKPTTEATDTTQRTNRWTAFKSILETMWSLELGVEANFISGSKAA